MRGKVRARVAAILPIAWLMAAGSAGAGPVRYVYQDGQFGVIGLPENTSRWPTHYRERAEALMARHFPQGYEIIRAEEVVEGSRTLTVGGQNTAMIGGASAIEHFFKIGNVGRTSTSSRADTLAIKECRILYKKADRPVAAADAKARVKARPRGGDFAAQASLTPAPYLDPNAVVRAQGGPKPVEVKTHSVAKPAPPAEKAEGAKPNGAGGEEAKPQPGDAESWAAQD